MEGLAPGDRIAAYRIERLIGRGGFGAVYLAEDTRLGRRVALKVITPELAGDPDVRRRFVAESRAAASLDHPNIIPIFEADEVEGHLFLAMRYVPGPDLEGRLAAQGRLPIDATVSIVNQVASALDAAHAVGLVHRDVKPGNILLASGSKPGLEHAYLADFGLTKQARGQRSATKEGQLVGSVGYVAPEQILGRAVDSRADVYSLGCVAFECLGGRPPFSRDSEVAQVLAHLDDPPPSLAELRPDTSAEVDQVIGRALSKDAEARYPSAGAFAAALAGAAERDPARDPLTRGFLFADLRGYTAFVETHGDRAAVDLLETYRRFVRDVVARRGGAEIKTEGDSFYVVFPSASGAVQAGLDIVARAEAATEERPDRPIHVGVGVHAGESAATAEGYVGSAVNIAARVCAQAAAGEVLVTETVRSLVRTSLPITLVPKGKRSLKGLDEPVACYAVTRASGAARSTTSAPPAKGADRRVVGAGVVGLVAVAAIVVAGAVMLSSGPGPTPVPAQAGSAAATAGASGGLPSVQPSIDAAAADWLAYTAIDLPGARYEAQGDGSPIECNANNAKVHLVRADGTGDVRLTDGSDVYESEPRWSPDGSLILFRGWEQNAGVQAYVVAPDGTGLRRVTDEHSRSGAEHPRWSPDGKRILYSVEGSTYTIRPDGTGRTTVHRDPYAELPEGESPPPDAFSMSQATWTADGRIGASRDGQLITMRDDGGDVRPVAPGFDQVVDDASWSPDGSRIVVQAHPAGDPPWPTGVDLYVLAADGSDIRQLTSADGDELRPSWSPDGSAVIYDTLVDGVPRVMTIPAAGGTATPITSPTATFTGCDATLGRPTGAVAAALANPSPAPSGGPRGFDRGPLTAGHYRVERFDPAFEFTVDNGWYGFRDYVDGWAIQPFGGLIAQPAELDAIKPQVIHTGECFDSPTEVMGTKPVDLYEALKARKDLKVTNASPINVGSTSGLQFEMTPLPGKPKSCKDDDTTALFESGQDSFWMYDADTMLVTALDVRGGTVAFLFETATDRMADARPIVLPILQSLRFDR